MSGCEWRLSPAAARFLTKGRLIYNERAVSQEQHPVLQQEGDINIRRRSQAEYNINCNNKKNKDGRRQVQSSVSIMMLRPPFIASDP